MASKSKISLRDLSNHRSSVSPENRNSSPLSCGLREHVPLLNSNLSPNYSTSCGSRQLNKLKKFLYTLQQFGTDISRDIGDTVRGFVLALVNSQMSIEDFHQRLQKATNFPLRPFVIPFLKANLPLLQRELIQSARLAQQTPLEYLTANENFLYSSDTLLQLGRKRRSPAIRRHNSSEEEDDRDDENIEDIPQKRHMSMHTFNSLDLRTSQRNKSEIPTFNEQCSQVENVIISQKMLAAIVSMAGKCRNTLVELRKISTLKHGIIDINRKTAEDAIREVKRQAITELRIAVLSAESRANELVTQERNLATAAILDAKRDARRECLKQDDSKTSCWNCGRLATETCSGCQTAKYCGSFCQHRHWDQHLSKCSRKMDDSSGTEESVTIKSEIDN